MAGSLIGPLIKEAATTGKKRKIAMVGTSSRGAQMWGVPVVKEFGHLVEFVGLCDLNPGRAEAVKKMMQVSCKTFVDFDKMLKETKPDVLIVATVDNSHHEQIIKGLLAGVDIITEKPMTTDEKKCQEILDAEKRSGRKVQVTFNLRYAPLPQKIYELLRSDVIGELTSVDFHWYLDVHHGADYFRRWHRRREYSGSLLVHKSTHHFDLMNWWVDSDPDEVFAYGALEFYGKNGPYRDNNCRPCPHKKDCRFYWDITKSERDMLLYVNNEQYDGYHRDGCVFKNDIDIFDKMAVQIKYANNVQLSYSLTAYSPYEGFRVSFNGKKGKMDAFIELNDNEELYDKILITSNFGKQETIQVLKDNTEHGGGDLRLRKEIFSPSGSDPHKQIAGTRDGAMSILMGIAAYHSIDKQQPVKIKDLTTLKPQARKLYSA
jgi:predicted dehydrogenase